MGHDLTIIIHFYTECILSLSSWNLWSCALHDFVILSILQVWMSQALSGLSCVLPFSAPGEFSSFLLDCNFVWVILEGRLRKYMYMILDRFQIHPSVFFLSHVSPCRLTKCMLLHNWVTIFLWEHLQMQLLTYSFSKKVSGQFHLQLTNYPMASFPMFELMCF